MDNKILKLCLILFVIVSLSACSNNNDNSITEETVAIETNDEQNNSEDEVEAVEETLNPNADFDEAAFYEMIDELEGIEKFYVQNDLFRLHSLLKYKKLKSQHDLEAILKRKVIYPVYLDIAVLDHKNGYVEFAPYAAEGYSTLVFWNLSNGEKLIATTSKYCGPICECEINFQNYNPKTNLYSDLKNQNVIKDFNTLHTYIDIPKLPDPYNGDEDPIELEFILPQKGKNILYCSEEKCVELVWNDGSFKPGKKSEIKN